MTFIAKTGVLHNADGSSQVENNGVKVVCGINGPMEAKPRQELPTTSYLEVIIRPDIGSPTTREKLMEDKLKSFLSSVVVGNLYPRQLIQINLQILEKSQQLGTSGSMDQDIGGDTSGDYDALTENNTRKLEDFLPELNCCINAISIALVDANISILKAFNSNIFIYNYDDQLLVNPGASNDNTSNQPVRRWKSMHLMVYGFKNGKVEDLLLSENVGRFSEKKLFQLFDAGSEQAQELHSEMRQHLVSSVANKFAYLS